jgi:hypothetical protein
MQVRSCPRRRGLWLIGIPWGNRDCEGEVRFVDHDGERVASDSLETISVTPLSR